MKRKQKNSSVASSIALVIIFIFMTVMFWDGAIITEGYVRQAFIFSLIFVCITCITFVVQKISETFKYVFGILLGYTTGINLTLIFIIGGNIKYFFIFTSLVFIAISLILFVKYIKK